MTYKQQIARAMLPKEGLGKWRWPFFNNPNWNARKKAIALRIATRRAHMIATRPERRAKMLAKQAADRAVDIDVEIAMA